MNTIHSSSLAYYPTGYVKPGIPSGGQKPASDELASRTTSAPNLPVSTPDQIQAALDKAGLVAIEPYQQPGNARTAKALASYTENNNQLLQRQVAEMISGIDLYA